MESVVWSARPSLRKGVLVCAFSGWNDGGEAATLSALFLRRQLDAQPFCEFDPDEFYDFQHVRPIVSAGEDDTRHISWPENSFAWAPLPSGNDIAVMLGVEPNNRWRHYSRSVIEVARESGAELVVTLGGFLADTPHTRPVPVTGSADGELADTLGLAPSSYEGPTGIVGVLHAACQEAGVPTASLWASVPHYVAAAPNPKAALALVRKLESLVGVTVDAEELELAASDYERQVSLAVQSDPDVQAFVERLERAAAEDPEMDPGDLPSGDVIAREFQRFLRQRGPEGPDVAGY